MGIVLVSGSTLWIQCPFHEFYNGYSSRPMKDTIDTVFAQYGILCIQYSSLIG